MNKGNFSEFNEKTDKLGTWQDAKNRYKVSRNAFMKLAGEAGGIVRIGGAVRFDFAKIDRNLEKYYD